MCGICGIFQYAGEAPVSTSLVRAMADSIAHRGPDDEGFHFEHGLGLGFRRLSIIDLETGNQPIPNEDRSAWVILNGEIYNYKDLRHELKNANHQFHTQTDTETIVHGYESWGSEVTSHLNGMFAFAVWDSRKRQLLLARDHLGIKPLYYYDDGKCLRFASEVKSILQDDRVPRELDLESLRVFMAFGFVPSPRTLFKGIRKLPPGYRLIVTERGCKLERYWQTIPQKHVNISFEEATEQYADLFRNAIHRQMVSDVPIGCLLSGGVDSAMVTAIMGEFSDRPIRTFSIGFEEKGHWNELDDAASTAALFKTEHHPLRINGNDFTDFFADSFWYLEEPVLSESTFAYYFLTKMARQEVKVVLTGQGADEPLAGYNRYHGEKLAGTWGWLAGSGLAQQLSALIPRAEKLRRATRSLGEKDPVRRFSKIHALFSPDEATQILTHSLNTTMQGFDAMEPIRKLQKDVAHLDGLSQLLFIDARLSLPDDLLFYGDKLSMANSLEARVPILDHELVEFVESLPPSFKLRGFNGKYIHKQVAKRWVPKEIIQRPKKGFATPMDSWFQNQSGGFVRDVILSNESICRDLFKTDYIENMLVEHKQRRRDHRRRIVALLSLELWHRRFLRSPVAVSRIES